MSNAYKPYLNQPARSEEDAVKQVHASQKRLQTVVWLCLLGFLVIFVWWGVQRPYFQLEKVQVTGDLTHYDQQALAGRVLKEANTLVAGGVDASVRDRLQLARASFFNTDVHALADWATQQPWIRKAVVRRSFPDALQLHVSEHEAVALWQSVEEGRLVNAYGEVFQASMEAEKSTDMPVFYAAEEGFSERVMTMYVTLNEVIAPLQSQIHSIRLDEDGSWTLELIEGATVEMGHGSAEEQRQKLQNFVVSLGVVNRADRPVGLALIERVDLRYPSGYALELKSVKEQKVGHNRQHAMAHGAIS